jgi:hypothetical protein
MVALDVSPAKSRRFHAAAVIVAGLATGFLTPPIVNVADRLDLPRGSGNLTLALGAAPFALLVVTIARRFTGADWWRAVVMGVVTVLAFDAAISVAANVSIALSGRMDPVQDVLGGLAGGLVGSGLMALAALVLRVGSRRVLWWLPLVAVGTVLGMLLAVDSYLHSDNVWVLFPAWQAGVALMLMRTLRKPD